VADHHPDELLGCEGTMFSLYQYQYLNRHLFVDDPDERARKAELNSTYLKSVTDWVPKARLRKPVDSPEQNNSQIIPPTGWYRRHAQPGEVRRSLYAVGDGDTILLQSACEVEVPAASTRSWKDLIRAAHALDSLDRPETWMGDAVVLAARVDFGCTKNGALALAHAMVANWAEDPDGKGAVPKDLSMELVVTDHGYLAVPDRGARTLVVLYHEGDEGERWADDLIQQQLPWLFLHSAVAENVTCRYVGTCGQTVRSAIREEVSLAPSRQGQRVELARIDQDLERLIAQAPSLDDRHLEDLKDTIYQVAAKQAASVSCRKSCDDARTTLEVHLESLEGLLEASGLGLEREMVRRPLLPPLRATLAQMRLDARYSATVQEAVRQFHSGISSLVGVDSERFHLLPTRSADLARASAEPIIPAPAVAVARAADDRPPSALVVAHLSDPHFGKHSRFASVAPEELGRNLARGFTDARERTAIKQEVDLVIVTGDFAELGKPAEFAQAATFLRAFGEALGLAADRFVLLPGNHDISWNECRKVAADQDTYGFSDKELRVKLDEVKFTHYWSFVHAFYGEGGLEIIARPLPHDAWLYDYPELGLSVAALNSCERESHRSEDHQGEVSRAQADALMEAWHQKDSEGWLRILAVHHNPVGTVPANLDEWRRFLQEKGHLPIELVARYEADAVGFEGKQFLKAIVEDAHVQLVLHGHHHASDEKLWSWKADGLAHVLSIGSLTMQTEALPKDYPNSCQLILLDRAGRRIEAHRLAFRSRMRLPGQVAEGAFVLESSPEDGYRHQLFLPSQLRRHRRR